MRSFSPRTTDSTGQALAMVAVSMMAILMVLALVVDGGNAWVQQRITQNGTDATAVAGATVLARRLGATPADAGITDAQWDSEVSLAITQFAAANGTAIESAHYTDICGRLLAPDGSAAADLASAAIVGAGVLPDGGGADPDTSLCATNPPVGPAAGVAIKSTRAFNTLVGKIVGINTFTAATLATAVVGYLDGACDASAGSICTMIPLALPPTLTYCDNTGRSVPTAEPYPLNTRVIIPICKNGAGNFGWLDWDPDDANNGASGLAYCISNQCPADWTAPTWLEIAISGNPSSSQIEDALNAHIGEVLPIPFFDHMCQGEPDNLQAADASPYGCPDSPAYDLEAGMNGNPNWYHLYQIGGFYLEHAYTNGNNSAECNPDWSPDGGSNDCIIGMFTSLVTGGPVGGINPGPVTSPELIAVSVQLIR